MTSPAFVDTHVHLWNLEHPELRYIWLEPGASHPQLSQNELAQLGAQSQSVERFIEETAGSGMTKWVHTEVAIGTEDPLAETLWLQELADEGLGPHAIVAAVSLQREDAAHELDRHSQAANFRGVRDQCASEVWESPSFSDGYAELGRRGLVCSLNALWQDMPRAAALARKHPETTMVLDHMGFPQERGAEYFRAWNAEMRRLAEAESVICKISEIGIMEPDWTAESIRPWILACIEAFGIQRCVFGTNWPVDRLYGSYTQIVGAYRQIISELSVSEQRALLSENAERLYRI
jgi:predicted TIM-barrel fold metal-dependent hydrolase